MEANVPGFVGELYCRTRHIDDVLNNVLAAGNWRIVILGSGFDARAYHIPGIERCISLNWAPQAPALEAGARTANI
jgi:O-methyltransferase involved in polyketide biosynthesis